MPSPRCLNAVALTVLASPVVFDRKRMIKSLLVFFVSYLIEYGIDLPHHHSLALGVESSSNDVSEAGPHSIKLSVFTFTKITPIPSRWVIISGVPEDCYYILTPVVVRKDPKSFHLILLYLSRQSLAHLFCWHMV